MREQVFFKQMTSNTDTTFIYTNKTMKTILFWIKISFMKVFRPKKSLRKVIEKFYDDEHSFI